MKKRLLFVFFIFILCLSGCSSNSGDGATEEYYEEEREYSEYVDVDALELIKDQDKFELKMTDTDYIDDYFTDTGYGDDNAIFYVENNSSDQITEFQFYVVAYKQDYGKALFRDEVEATWYTKADICIEPGSEYVLEVDCHGEEFYDFTGIIRNFTTSDGEYYENELAEEWYDIALYGSGKDSEEVSSTLPEEYYDEYEDGDAEEYGDAIDIEPPSDEYDEILGFDERYYLCKKTESGFDTNSTKVSIFDCEIQDWTMDFIELGSGDLSSTEFFSLGDGVFGYEYFGDSGNMISGFVSADLGDYFTMNLDVNAKSIQFVDGYAFVLVPNDEDGYIDGRIIPDSVLCRLSTTGKVEEYKLKGYKKNDIYWSSSTIVEAWDSSIYAKSFNDAVSDQTLVFVYFYEENEYIIIDDQRYTTSLSLYYGEDDDNSKVSMFDDIIRIDKLQGEDGELYYIDFDREGNVVGEATRM